MSKLPTTTDQAMRSILDAALPTGNPPAPSGNKQLDACLSDPEVNKAIGATTIGVAGAGFLGGAAVGVVGGAAVMGLVWALWPKKKG